MGAGQRLFQIGHADAGIDLGGLQGRVPQQTLHIDDISPIGDQMRGAGVPPDMGRDGAPQDALGVAPDNVRDGFDAQRLMRLDGRQPERIGRAAAPRL